MFKRKKEENLNPQEPNQPKTKKPIYKRPWFIVLAGLIVLGALFGGDDATTIEVASTETAETTENVAETEQVAKAEKVTEIKTETETKTETEVEIEEIDTTSLTVKELVEYQAKEIFGDNYISSQAFPADSVGDAKTNIDVKLADNLTTNMMIDGQLAKTTKLLEKLQGQNLGEVFIGAKTEFSNPYGETSEQYAVKVFINQEDIDRIQFENFYYKNLFDIATVEIHPGVDYQK